MSNTRRAMALSLTVFLAAATAANADASLTLVSGNTLNGNQGTINAVGSAGTISGLAAGDYTFSLTRTPHNFTTQNLQLSVGSIFWSNFGAPHLAFIDNVPTSFSISGVIPHGVECGEYENVVLKIFNTAGAQVIENDLKIQNPVLPAPVTNFKINGNASASPTPISINNETTPYITLTYTGSGTVTQYRIYVVQAYANGTAIPNGAASDTSWHNGPAPGSLNVRTLGGGTFVQNQLALHAGYYRVTMETTGSVCAYGGAAPHSALLHVSDPFIPVNGNGRR